MKQRSWPGTILITLAAGAVTFSAPPALAEIELVQAGGGVLTLDRPARRIITLAPNLTELVFASGAQDLLIATVEYSDFPPQAQELPRIGDAFRIDLERIKSMEPDLVIAWDSGNPASALAALEDLELAVWRTEITFPEGIAQLIGAIGKATDREDTAAVVQNSVLHRLSALRTEYAGREPVRYFFQVYERPLYTFGGQHLVSSGLDMCGGENIFNDLNTLAPQVSVESVIQADPDVLLAGKLPDGQATSLDHWKQWPRLAAVQADMMLYLPADEITRATPRMLDSLELACTLFDQFRASHTQAMKQVKK